MSEGLKFLCRCGEEVELSTVDIENNIGTCYACGDPVGTEAYELEILSSLLLRIQELENQVKGCWKIGEK